VKRELADGYALRFARDGDGASLADIATRAGAPVDAAVLDVLAAANRVFVVDDVFGMPAGLAAVGEAEGLCLVEALGVLPGHRRHGAGSALLTSVEEFARWAYYAAVVVPLVDAAATPFLFRRGYLAADAGRLTGGLADRSGPAGLVVRRL
jgi:GNAT superfamily N-acetyltransferase